MFICTIIPAIVYTSVWLIFRFGYPLTKEKMEPIYKSLREKHEAEAKAEVKAECPAEKCAECPQKAECPKAQPAPEAQPAQ